MRIAILGATSQIAKDLIVTLSKDKCHELVLFARRPASVDEWLLGQQLGGRYPARDYSSFSTQEHFDAVLNFVGVGNPARAVAMGETIFGVTLEYDELVLAYLHEHPTCRYLFMSSGAAYGGNFSEPVDENSCANVAINRLAAQDWYGVAKLYAECRHRALPELPIVDIRIFSYFSSSQDINARFLISDALRAIRSETVLQTSSDNIVRDFIGPDDFHGLVIALLSEPPSNDVVDCYTRASVDKLSLLDALRSRFGLRYSMPAEGTFGVNATGIKRNYFSTNRRAARFGYVPRYDSIETVMNGASLILCCEPT